MDPSHSNLTEAQLVKSANLLAPISKARRVLKNAFIKAENNQIEEYASTASMFKSVMNGIKQLNLEQYSELVGNLFLIQQGDSNQIPVLEELPDKQKDPDKKLDTYQLIQRIFNNALENRSDPKKTAMELILYLRAAYPLGIDILTAGNVHKSESLKSLSADSNLTIRLTNKENSPPLDHSNIGQLTFTPDIRSTKISFAPPSQGGQEVAPVEFDLAEGQSVVIGRSYIMKSFLNIPLNTETIFPTEDPNVFSLNLTKNSAYSRRWSRGALFVIRKDNQLYFFDRGCSYGLQIEDHTKNIAYGYQPDVVQLTLDGLSQTSYGETKVFRIK